MLDDGKSDSQVTVEFFSGFDEISSLQEEWDDFVEKTGGDLFLTYDWCKIWWKYYGFNRILHIYIFRDGNNIVGILPLFRETLWLGPIHLNAVKIVGSDFILAQFSLPVSKEYLSEVVRVLLDKLSAFKWDVLHIGQIAGLYADYDLWVSELKRNYNHTLYVFPKKRGEQTYFELTKNWDSYLACLSKNGRRNVKRKYKQLDEYFAGAEGTLDSIVVTEEKLAAEMDKFIDLHQHYWQMQGLPGHFSEWPNSSEFHKEMAYRQYKKLRTRLMVCRCGNIDLSYEYGYQFGDKHFALWNSRLERESLAHLSIGIISSCELIKCAINEKREYVDLMRGRFEYKLRLGGKVYSIRSLYICRRRLSAVIRGLLFRVTARTIHEVYFQFWRKKICPKLRRFTPLWKVWIKTHMFG